MPASGKGYVTRFLVAKRFLDRYQVQQVEQKDHLEYWIPAEDLEAFNEAIIGPIEVVAESVDEPVFPDERHRSFTN